jgi:hypothetical protein
MWVDKDLEAGGRCQLSITTPPRFEFGTSRQQVYSMSTAPILLVTWRVHGCFKTNVEEFFMYYVESYPQYVG